MTNWVPAVNRKDDTPMTTDAGTMEIVELENILDDHVPCCGFGFPCANDVEWAHNCPGCGMSHLFCAKCKAIADDEMKGRKSGDIYHQCGYFFTGGIEQWRSRWIAI